MPLDEDTVRLAQGKNLATVVTLMPNGQPQALLTWVDSDGEYVLVNTEPQRQRARNIRRDPRITVLIHSDTTPGTGPRCAAGSSRPSTAARPASTSTSCPASTWAPTTATRSGRKAG